MPPAKATAKTQATDDAGAALKPAEKKMLYSLLTHLRGHVNFDKIASDIEVPNGEAARKRLKRFLEKESIPTLVRGDRLGGDEDEEGTNGATKVSVKTPTKAKASPATMGDSNTPKAGRKKRKVDESKEDHAEVQTEVQTEEQTTDTAKDGLE